MRLDVVIEKLSLEVKKLNKLIENGRLIVIEEIEEVEFDPQKKQVGELEKGLEVVKLIENGRLIVIEEILEETLEETKKWKKECEEKNFVIENLKKEIISLEQYKNSKKLEIEKTNNVENEEVEEIVEWGNFNLHERQELLSNSSVDPVFWNKSTGECLIDFENGLTVKGILKFEIKEKSTLNSSERLALLRQEEFDKRRKFALEQIDRNDRRMSRIIENYFKNKENN